MNHLSQLLMIDLRLYSCTVTHLNQSVLLYYGAMIIKALLFCFPTVCLVRYPFRGSCLVSNHKLDFLNYVIFFFSHLSPVTSSFSNAKPLVFVTAHDILSICRGPFISTAYVFCLLSNSYFAIGHIIIFEGKLCKFCPLFWFDL